MMIRKLVLISLVLMVLLLALNRDYMNHEAYEVIAVENHGEIEEVLIDHRGEALAFFSDAGDWKTGDRAVCMIKCGKIIDAEKEDAE